MNRCKHTYLISRNHYLLRVFFLIILLRTLTICEAQIELSHFTYYEHYGQENGLASIYTSDIKEDKYGYLWIATANGLSRFDGNYFTNYSYFYKDSVKQKIGFVRSIEMDILGEGFWIGTERGIYYTSVDTIKFQNIDKSEHSEKNSRHKSNDILLSKQNTLWSASSSNGLWSCDLKDNQQKRYSFESDLHQGNTKLNSLQCISEDPNDNNTLWIGTLAGLIEFNTVSEEYQIYIYEENPEMAQNKIRKIAVSNEEVYLGTWHEGLIVFNKQSKQFRLPLKDEYPNSHTLILDIYKENDSSLWITSSDGLILYNEHSKSITSVTEHNLENGLLRGISYIDSRGIIWFAHGKGLFKYDPLQSKNNFVELEKRNKLQNPLLVRKIIPANGLLYVAGQYSSGLYVIDLSDRSVKVIKLPMFEYHEKVGYILMNMVDMGDGNFLLLTDKNIAIFNLEKQTAISSNLQIKHPNPSLQCVVKDRDNNYWIGGREGGLYCLNFEANSIKNYKEEFNEFRDENHRWINKLFIDSENKLWIGKGSSSVMDLNNYSLSLIDPDNKSKIVTYKDVLEFYEDKKGRVWMAGASNGLGYTSFKNFNKGVSHQVDGYFSGVFAYNDSLLWTTGKGLGVFNTLTMSYHDIKLSSKNKRLRILGPVISAGNSDFAIGCDNGVLFYNPEKQQFNKEIPIPYIRSIESAGKTIYSGNNLSLRDFTFDVGTKQLVFKISSLGFHFPNQIKYQYRFEGDWQDIGTDKEINLANLSYGKYKLQIRAINNQGISREKPGEYNITIPSPLWIRWWAFIIYLAIAILLADRFYRFQLSKRLAIADSIKFKEINHLRNSLYTNITHEFRTPLTVILGMADSLTTAIREKSLNGVDHSLELIRRNGNNLLRLVNQMLDLSKIESGNMSLQLIQVDVISFIKYLSESFHSLAQEKQINLTLYSEVDELWMDVDANKLSVIISNLLSNAVKFTPNGGSIILHLNQYNGDLLLKVKDSGAGIPEEEIKNIFNQFYQVDNLSSRKGEGTGIGLALTKEFVELMNGNIEVKSKPDKGSEFIIQLPISRKAAQTKDIHVQLKPYLSSFEMEEPLQKVSNNNSELPLALIIEDNMDVTHYLKTCLTGKYQTLHSANGEIGIETAFEQVPDIIICDVMMPKKDGFEVCKALKSDERTDHIPVILLTAKAALKDKLTGLSYGADAYLTKPFVKAELLTRLDQLVLSRKKLLQKINDDTLGKILKKRSEDPETKFLQKIIKIINDETGNHSFGSSMHLARKMHLSESQIYRKLKAITGKSTAVFIRSVRLQKAKELIQTTDKTISEVAYEVGFNDPSWFSRAFKEEYGYAPSEISK